jgi:spore coat protein U-like protein
VVVNPGRPVRSRDHTLLGQIPPRQTVSPGTYQDTIFVTVTFN